MRTIALRAIPRDETQDSVSEQPRQILQDWFSRIWGPPPSQLDATTRDQVEASWGPGTLNALRSLADENNSEIFWSDFYSLGVQAEALQNPALAQAVYEEIQRHQPQGPWGLRAQTRLDLFNGGGPLGDRLEWSAHRLVDQVTDVGVLAGLGVGSYGFHWARGSILRFLGTDAFRARALANLGGFFTEVPGMVFTTRSVHHFIPPAGGASPLSLGQEMGHMGLTLLALRSAGGLTHQLLGPWGRSTLGSRALPQLAMFNGILAMRSLEIHLGWANPQGSASFLVDSLAMLIQFNAMSRLLPHPQGSQRPAPRRHGNRPQEFYQFPILAGIPGSLGKSRASVFDAMVLSMSQRPTSSVPPPMPSEPRTTRPQPTRSGVQLRGDRAEYDPILQTLSRLDQEIYDFYGTGGRQRTGWRSQSLSTLRRTQECLLWLDEVYKIQNPAGGSMPHLQELIREVGESYRLLSEFSPNPHANGLTGLQADLVDGFLRHHYEVPNKTINFFNGDAALPDVIQSARLSRLSLQDYIESHRLPQGPVFSPSLNAELVIQANGIGQEFFRAFAFSPRRPWYGGTVEAVENYGKFLAQVRQRFSNGGKPLIYSEETLGTQHEVESALQKLTRTGETPQGFLDGPKLKILMDNLYRAPLAYADFLKTGRLSYLRTSRHHISVAKEVLAPAND